MQYSTGVPTGFGFGTCTHRTVQYRQVQYSVLYLHGSRTVRVYVLSTGTQYVRCTPVFVRVRIDTVHTLLINPYISTNHLRQEPPFYPLPRWGGVGGRARALSRAAFVLFWINWGLGRLWDRCREAMRVYAMISYGLYLLVGI